MPFDVERLSIPDVILIKPRIFKDERGEFLETFREVEYQELLNGARFVQDNVSRSKKNVIRGLHYQIPPHAQGKLCQVLYGCVRDVAVDIRKNSPTFGKYVWAELSDENRHQLWIPPGFAHGYAVLSENAVFQYKCTDYYSPAHERSICFDDADLNIDWGIESPIVSERDKKNPIFQATTHGEFAYEIKGNGNEEE